MCTLENHSTHVTSYPQANCWRGSWHEYFVSITILVKVGNSIISFSCVFPVRNQHIAMKEELWTSWQNFEGFVSSLERQVSVSIVQLRCSRCFFHMMYALRWTFLNEEKKNNIKVHLLISEAICQSRWKEVRSRWEEDMKSFTRKGRYLRRRKERLVEQERTISRTQRSDPRLRKERPIIKEGATYRTGSGDVIQQEGTIMSLGQRRQSTKPSLIE